MLNNATVYVMELTFGFEFNIKLNSDSKANKYHTLIGSLQKSYSTVKFVNLSMSALGIFGTSSESLLSMLTELHFYENTKQNMILKTLNIAVRCSYYIFIRRSKSWTLRSSRNVRTYFCACHCYIVKFTCSVAK